MFSLIKFVLNFQPLKKEVKLKHCQKYHRNHFLSKTQVRENQRGVDRLLAANNRLLVRDALAWEPAESNGEGDAIGMVARWL